MAKVHRPQRTGHERVVSRRKKRAGIDKVNTKAKKTWVTPRQRLFDFIELEDGYIVVNHTL